jgi:tetratricopeptide (TPR) repeat protein
MLGWKSVKARLTGTLTLGFALLAWAGCSTVWMSPHNAQIKSEIAQAEYFASRGDYDAAIRGYERTLEKSPQNPWRDRVLLNLGCLYASDGNPEKDFARSLSCFQKLRDEFPIAGMAQVQVWVAWKTRFSRIRLGGKRADFGLTDPLRNEGQMSTEN